MIGKDYTVAEGPEYNGIDWQGNSESLSLINSRMMKRLGIVSIGRSARFKHFYIYMRTTLFLCKIKK